MSYDLPTAEEVIIEKLDVLIALLEGIQEEIAKLHRKEVPNV